MEFNIKDNLNTKGEKLKKEIQARKQQLKLLLSFNLTEIKDNAFENKILSSIIIPSNVTTIGNRAFLKSKLKKIVFPKGIKKIGEAAFYDNCLTKLVIPDTVEYIDNYAFYNNELKEVQLSNKLKTIRSNTFSSNSLIEIIIPDSVEIIEKDAFSYNYLTKVKLSENLKIIGTSSFESNNLEELILPNSVEVISSKAFSGNPLKSIYIPDSTKTIGEMAFSENELTEVRLPNNLLKIKKGIFERNKLASIVIPDNVEVIEKYAFYQNELTDLKLSNKLKRISEQAFSKNKLTSLTIPKSVEEIERGAFEANELVTVKFRNGLKIIGPCAFSKNKITELYIPNSVEEIGAWAFSSNNSLRKLKLPINLKKIETGAFQSNKLDQIAIPNSVKTIESQAFMDNMLTSLIIPEGVEVIGNHAFSGNLLTKVTIPDSVKRMAYNAFSEEVLLKNNAVLKEIVDLINKISRNKITDIEEFYEENAIIQKLCSELVRYKLSNFQNDYQKLLTNFKKIYFKTRLEYLPSFDIIENINDYLIENFDLNVWNSIAYNEIFNINEDTEFALLEMIEVFGLFNHDKNKYNRLNKVKEIIGNKDYTLTKEQYAEIPFYYHKYFEEKTRKELRLKENYNIPEDATFYLKEIISPTRYKYIKNLTGTEGARINKLLNELYEEVDSEYYEPSPNNTDAENKKINSLINKLDIPGFFTMESIHRMFPGELEEYTFNDEAYQFLIKYFDIILSDEKIQSLIPVIVEKFPKIKIEYNISEGILPTLKQCYDYCMENDFEYTFGNKELADMASLAGVASVESYEYYQDLNEKVQRRKTSVLVRNEAIYNYNNIILRCRLLRSDDPFAMFVGEINYTNCCQSHEGAGEKCMEHSATSLDGGIFEVSYLKDGHWIQLCQSWDWQNEGLYCHDNIEATLELKINPELIDAVAYAYKENAKEILKKSSTKIDEYIEKRLKKIDKIPLDEKQQELNILKELKLRQKIKIVTVGTGCSDIKLSKYFSNKINKIRQPKNYHDYSDSKREQYIIAGNENELIKEATDYQQLAIYRDERRIATEIGDNIKSSTLKLMHDIEKEVYPKEMLNYSTEDGPIIINPTYLANVQDGFVEDLKVLHGEDWYLLYSVDYDKITVHDLAKGTPRLSDEKHLQTTEINEALKLLIDESIKEDKILEADLKEDTSYLIYLMYLRSGLIEQLGYDLEYNFNDNRNTKKVSPKEQLTKLKRIKEIRKKSNPEMIMHKIKFKPSQKYIDYYHNQAKKRIIVR